MPKIRERALTGRKITIEVTTLPAPEAADWLDAYCWGCGSDRAAPDPEGRLLCRSCRGELFGIPNSSADGMRVAQELYWDSHALERCWRCMERTVDPGDDLGLCGRCRDVLSRPSGGGRRDRSVNGGGRPSAA